MKNGILLEKGKQINEKVEIIENTVSEGQINVVLRTEDNEAFGILKLVENSTDLSTALDKNITANYVYISENLKIDSIKFKVKITESETLNNTGNNEMVNESILNNQI